VRTADAAIGKWFGILTGLGVDERFLKNRHGPCPMCGGKDRFRYDDKNGTGSYFCSGCGAGDGMNFAIKITGKSFKETAQQIDQMVGTIKTGTVRQIKRDPAIALRKIYTGSTEPQGTIVETYLGSRGLELPASGLSFHPDVAYYEQGKFVDKYPAMLATYSNADGQPITLHITYLTDDGRKRDLAVQRKIMPPKEPLNGGAIRLFDHEEALGVLGVAEGIETALAASQLEKLPVWACANANMLEQWQPPSGIEWVHIYADNDRNYTGQSAAYRLANRLSLAGIKVLVFIPDMFGDWNDFLLSNRNRAIA
jgi:putative DNA primase/helicase